MGLLRILIVEDDNDIIELLRSVLEPPFECYKACNGLDGLQRAIQGQPDLIICDIMMPTMDGREFIKRLRREASFDQVPVIFLSALGSREQICDGYQLGAALYLTKPIDAQRLRRNVELFVQDHKLEPRNKRLTVRQLMLSEAAPKGTTPRPNHAPPFSPGTGTAGPRVGSADDDVVIKRDTVIVPDYAGRGLRDDVIRIMIVEDDPDASLMIRQALTKEYEVLDAPDGIAAYEQSSRYKPDLFIIDGILPRMTGYQLTTMLRKNRAFYKTPIIFISGKASARDQQYVQRLGVKHFLPKPFTVKQLKDMVQRVVTDPSFRVLTDRMDSNQVFLEQLQQHETTRLVIPTVEQMDRMSVELTLKKQADQRLEKKGAKKPEPAE